MNAAASTDPDSRDRESSGESSRNDAVPACPPGYSRLSGPSYELIAHNDVVQSMQQVLSTNASLYEWASKLPQTVSLRGRAPVYVGALPGIDAVVAVRHVWHGGMFAPLTKDRFRVPTRAGVELTNSLRLREVGIGTTEILGYVLYNAGPGLRRVDVASRYLPDTVDFGTVLSERAPRLLTASALPAVGSLLMSLAHHRVVHPDLNVKNILLQLPAHNGMSGALTSSNAPDAVSAFVIDVDVVRFDVHRSASDVMSVNLARLMRSIRKWRTRFGAVIGDDVIERLERDCHEAVQ